jgi:hypothetical protein
MNALDPYSKVFRTVLESRNDKLLQYKILCVSDPIMAEGQRKQIQNKYLDTPIKVTLRNLKLLPPSMALTLPPSIAPRRVFVLDAHILLQPALLALRRRRPALLLTSVRRRRRRRRARWTGRHARRNAVLRHALEHAPALALDPLLPRLAVHQHPRVEAALLRVLGLVAPAHCKLDELRAREDEGELASAQLELAVCLREVVLQGCEVRREPRPGGLEDHPGWDYHPLLSVVCTCGTVGRSRFALHLRARAIVYSQDNRLAPLPLPHPRKEPRHLLFHTLVAVVHVERHSRLLLRIRK